MRRGIIPISSTGTSVRFRTPLQTNNYIVLKDCYDSSGSNTLGCSITNKSNLGFTATSTDVMQNLEKNCCEKIIVTKISIIKFIS